jgi:2-hydroxy-3-oxopropionate reductase
MEHGMKLGLIGPGIMGRPMAENLLRAGYALHVHARRQEAAAPLLAAGATWAASPAALAAACDVSLVVVSATADVEEVVLGARGVIQGAAPGHVVVDMSSISPAVTRRMATQLAARGLAMLDAPVSGGEAGARDGSLSIMVGGDAVVFARLVPVFEVLGRNIVHVGDHGAGQVAKCANQIVVSLTIQGVAEALLLARRNGVDPARVRAALLGGFAASRILEVHGQRMLEGDYRPGFKARLHHKDMGVVQENAIETGSPHPGTALVAAQIASLLEAGDGELDSSALLKALEALAP